jgi:23S rRNA pseudouridine955/2504/2580 synthase
MSEIRKESVSQIMVTSEDAGQRLDNFLLRLCKGVPKSHVYRILRSGEVRVNGGRSDAAYRIIEGDRVRVPPIRLPAKPEEGVAAAIRGSALKNHLPIAYEDDALLAINKPAGLAAHGGSGVAYGVIEALRIQRPEARFLELAHRLDRETSGLLLVGKKRSALRGLHAMFREGKADKRYLVMVNGTWLEAVRDVRLPLLKFNQSDGERRVRVDDRLGQTAHTIFRRLASGPRFSLLEAQLKTGRTHQIRVHLAHLGFPILGDEKYGDFSLNRTLAGEGFKRMFLHAWRMRFQHPLSGETLSLEVPPDMTLNNWITVTRQRKELGDGEKI